MYGSEGGGEETKGGVRGRAAETVRARSKKGRKRRSALGIELMQRRR